MRYLSIGQLQRLCSTIAVLIVGFSWPAAAGKLVLKIQAVNKADSPQPVELRRSLPDRITADDILDLDGFNLGYDVRSDTYYVYDTVQMASKDILVREVTMKDIWVIDEALLANYRTRSDELKRLLAGTGSSADSEKEQAKVQQRTEEIVARQRENTITTVSYIRHIQAYESNLKALQEVRQSVGRLENLTMAEGLNPGSELIGDDQSAAAPRRDVHFPTQYGEAIYKITVHNNSATLPRTVGVRKDLPPEIAIDDVIDSGGLEVQYDPKAHLAYVFKDAVEVQPQETLTFDVRIRDKWNINGARMAFLQQKGSQLLGMTSGRANIEAVENTLKGALEALEGVMKEVGPETLSPAYISFYRRQADRLDEVERDLNRVDSALKPLDTNRGFDIPAPDKKTTWLIIYVILGFLALVSLLFFLRWYVRSS